LKVSVTTTTDATQDEVAPEETPTSSSRSDRAALGVFALWVAIALPVLLFGLGAYYWFFRDDFSFIVNQSLAPHALFRAQSGSHWSTVPILVYRALYEVFGLHSYRAYQFFVIVLHLSVCGLLWVIMRRAGVQAWIATACAGAFIFFGPGQQNIIWAFQIGFTGSVAFGLAQLVLADHDGPIDKRDFIGLGFGFLSLLSSGVGVAMALVVGVSTFIRRGWRATLVNVAPLALAYVIWASIVHPSTDPLGRPPTSLVSRWVWNAVSGTFEALTHFTALAIVLAVLVVCGLVLAWWGRPLAEFRRRAAMPIAMTVGALAFSITASFGRWFLGADYARVSRYLHIGTALLLPVIAVGVDAIARRWRVLTVPVIVLFLIAIPWNLTKFDDGAFGPQYMRSTEDLFRNVIRIPAAHDVPRSTQPSRDPLLSDVTIGFLLQAERDGKLSPGSTPLTPTFVNHLKLSIGLQQRYSTTSNCRRVRGHLDVIGRRGKRLGILSAVRVTTRSGNRATSHPETLIPAFGSAIDFVLPLHVRFEPAAGQAMVLCNVPAAPRAG
jgi:hypothetical protein